MTRSEQQNERYLRTPCPQAASRKKMKQIGMSTYEVDKRLDPERRIKLAEKQMRPTPSKEGNLAAFIGMLRSLGGEYTILRFKPPKKKKVHTSGRRETQKAIKQVTEITEDKVMKIAESDDQTAMYEEHRKDYWRNRHGTLRRVFR